MPLPRPETTPPVTKIYFVMLTPSKNEKGKGAQRPGTHRHHCLTRVLYGMNIYLSILFLRECRMKKQTSFLKFLERMSAFISMMLFPEG